MTELEWLKQESGLTEDELKAMQAVAGQTKFVAMLQKIIGTNESATAAAKKAEEDRLSFEKRYNDEFVPEMRKVTQDALTAKGEAARLAAQLQQAREYGIVPEPVAPVVDPNAPPVRAPGSPDPEAQFRAWSAAQSRAINNVSELNAEHFRLFKEPLPSSADLADEVQRQHTLGHKEFTLKQAWETKYNVPAKRAEIQVEVQKKHDDEIRAQVIKEERQRVGAHPGLVSGQSSRFSNYKPSDATEGKEPWKVPAGMRKQANEPWRQKAIAKVSNAA